MTENIPYLLTH